MTYPRGPWRQGRIHSILMWLSIGVVVLWLGRALSGNFDMRRISGGAHALSMSAGRLFLLAIFLAVGGLLLWKGLTYFFWRKYFPAQEPPELPRNDKNGSGAPVDKRGLWN